MKRCSRCKIEKEESDYSKCSSKKSGLQTYCKGCAKEYRESDIGKISNQKHKQSPRYKKLHLEYQKQYNKTDVGKAVNQKRHAKYYKVHPEKKTEYGIRRYLTLVIKPIVLKRDNYQCQMCLDIPKKLHCHHLIPVKYAPDKIEDINNMITLCTNCHIKAHDGNWKSYDPVWADLALEHINNRERGN